MAGQSGPARRRKPVSSGPDAAVPPEGERQNEWILADPYAGRDAGTPAGGDAGHAAGVPADADENAWIHADPYVDQTARKQAWLKDHPGGRIWPGGPGWLGKEHPDADVVEGADLGTLLDRLGAPR